MRPRQSNAFSNSFQMGETRRSPAAWGRRGFGLLLFLVAKQPGQLPLTPSPHSHAVTNWHVVVYMIFSHCKHNCYRISADKRFSVNVFFQLMYVVLSAVAVRRDGDMTVYQMVHLLATFKQQLTLLYKYTNKQLESKKIVSDNTGYLRNNRYQWKSRL